MFDNKKPNGGCPGSKMQQSAPLADSTDGEAGGSTTRQSELAQWPVQLTLVPPTAPYFKKAHLSLVADCVPFAYNDYHKDFLKGRSIVVGCPKLDDLQSYIDKLAEIFKQNDLKSVEVLLMEVPCCGGLAHAARVACEQAGVSTPIKVTTIGVRGENFGSIDL
ncbi:MAG: hypothetical protein ACE5FH_05540 [Candidatus Zixiibacteriota bacterium]